MSRKPTILSPSQQELLRIVRAAHDNLIVARQVRLSEITRRLAEARIEFERELANAEARIRREIDHEIAAHESAEDEAVIAAYEAGIPVRRIALDGFGNRLDGAVHAKLRDLRHEGRVGNVSKDGENVSTFPQPIDVSGLLLESNQIKEPTFRALPTPLELVEPSSPDAADGVYVDAVLLTMDDRDAYFARIAKNMRKGTPFAKATAATLYLHPHSGALTVLESKEKGDILWDHPVARWVKDHPAEARAGFDAAFGL